MNIKIFLITLMMLCISISASADIALRFNYMGEFVPPDKILQERGVKDYENGKLISSISHFERSAKFGNEMSKYMIALIHFEKKDWVTGYAWLRIVQKPIDDRDELLNKFSDLLTKEEIRISNKKLESLKLTYNNYESFKRRKKWEKSIHLSGTHISGLHNISNNLSLDPGGHTGNLMSVLAADRSASDSMNVNASLTSTSSLGMGHSLKEYMLEYMPQGIVIPGEIKEKND